MKISVSLPDADVEFLDEIIGEQGLASRSAVVHRAVRLLRATTLGASYAEAWQEWDASGDGALWDGAVGDGIDD